MQHHHRWVAERIEELDTPLLVCEPVLAEAMHLLARFSRAHDALFGLLENGALLIAFRIDEHISVLRKLWVEPARLLRSRRSGGARARNCGPKRQRQNP